MKAKYKLKENIELYFETKEETVIKVSSVDYSLGQLETNVETKKNTYYVVAGDTTPLIYRYTVLNFLTEPRVTIHGVFKN